MKNWEKKKLGDICGFVRGPFGGSLKKNIFKPEGYAVYEQQHAIYDQFDDIRYFIDENKFNEMKRFELNSGDLIMSCSGTMGKIAIVPENIKKGIINQALLKLTPSKKISTVFLKLWMQSESFQESLKEYSGGAAIQNVASVAILKQIEIPLPPLPEQQRIVSILDEAFAAIAKAKANAEQNLKNAKELFESYLQGVFEKKGEGWEECNLEDNIKLIDYRGRTPQKTENGVRLITAKNVKLGFLQLEPQEFIAEDNYDSWMTRGIPIVGDVIFTTEAPLANVAQIESDEKLAFAQRIIVMQPNRKKLNPTFLKYMLLSTPIRNKILGKGTGATVVGIKSSLLKKIPITFPKSIDEQQTIVRQLDALRAETQKLEAVYQKKIADLEELKKSILQKAFAGELRSPEGPAYDSEAATPLADDNDGHSPSDKKKKSITSPEGVK